MPVVTSLKDFPFDDLANIQSIISPSATDSHVAVLCAIKGIRVARSLSEVHAQRADELVRIRAQPIQASVVDEDDIHSTKYDPRVVQYFVRWEHVLYRYLRKDYDPLRLLQESVSVIAGMAQAANAKPLILRLPDIRSDDPLARSFGLPNEPNPTLGVHGSRYWIAASTKQCDALGDACRQLAGVVTLAAPFIDSPNALTRLEERLGINNLIPFVETPSFAIESHHYAGLDQVEIGLKDLSHLLHGLDREGPLCQSHTPTGVLLAGARFVADGIRTLMSGGTRVAMYCPPKLQDNLIEAVGSDKWVASMPNGMLARSQEQS